jgi:CrcB protein
MRDVLLVAAGGALGAVSRYGVGLAAAKLLGKSFPWGTLAVNLAGCFVMGLVIYLLEGLEAAPRTSALETQLSLWHKGVAIGFLGGLTTFSSFGADTLRHFQAGQTSLALANIGTNVVLSLVAVWLGWAVMRSMS